MEGSKSVHTIRIRYTYIINIRIYEIEILTKNPMKSIHRAKCFFSSIHRVVSPTLRGRASAHWNN